VGSGENVPDTLTRVTARDSAILVSNTPLLTGRAVRSPPTEAGAPVMIRSTHAIRPNRPIGAVRAIRPAAGRPGVVGRRGVPGTANQPGRAFAPCGRSSAFGTVTSAGPRPSSAMAPIGSDRSARPLRPGGAPRARIASPHAAPNCSVAPRDSRVAQGRISFDQEPHRPPRFSPSGFGRPLPSRISR
jgi:hypothetical protein